MNIADANKALASRYWEDSHTCRVSAHTWLSGVQFGAPWGSPLNRWAETILPYIFNLPRESLFAFAAKLEPILDTDHDTA